MASAQDVMFSQDMADLDTEDLIEAEDLMVMQYVQVRISVR